MTISFSHMSADEGRRCFERLNVGVSDEYVFSSIRRNYLYNELLMNNRIHD